MLPENYLSGLRAELSAFRARLEPLEAGWMWIGDRDSGATEAMIIWLKRNIADYQSLIDRRHA